MEFCFQTDNQKATQRDIQLQEDLVVWAVAQHNVPLLRLKAHQTGKCWWGGGTVLGARCLRRRPSTSLLLPSCSAWGARGRRGDGQGPATAGCSPFSLLCSAVGAWSCHRDWGSIFWARHRNSQSCVKWQRCLQPHRAQVSDESAQIYN